MQTKLTLVVAPAGYGKTTLLVQWLNSVNQNNQLVSWVSLDEYDNNPVRFWGYIIEALGNVMPEVKTDLRGIVKQVCDPASCVLITGLVNAISKIPQSIGLVLDDYHVILNESIHKDIEFLLHNLPRNLHIVISSRKQPPISFARLMANGWVINVGSEDLEFTLDETRAYFEQVIERSLSLDELRQINSLVEGWIAGLQLAGLSLKRLGDINSFLRGLAGSHSNILDYLGEEVLRQQNESSQDFLMQTSILEHLSASLCDTVRGKTDSDQMLESMVASNLFISPIQPQSEWYHYHPLFREVLQRELSRRSPGLLLLLHQRASIWFEKNGYPEEAIDQALVTGDNQRKIQLIEKNYSLIWNNFLHGNDWLEHRLFKQISKEEILNNLSLSKLNLWLMIRKDQTEDVQSVLPLIEGILDPKSIRATLISEPPDTKAELDIIRAVILMLQMDYKSAKEFSLQMLRSLKDDEDSLRPLLQFVFGYSAERTGDIAQAAQSYGEIISFLQPDQKVMLPAFIKILYSRLLHLQGKLNQSASLCQIEPGIYQGSETLEWYCIDGALSIRLGRLQLEWGQIEASKQSIERGVDLIASYVSHGGNKYWQYEAQIGSALLFQAQGDLSSAWKMISRSPCNDRNVNGCYGIKLDYLIEQARMAILKNDLNHARYLDAQLGNYISSDDVIYAIIRTTLQVRIALAEQRLGDIPQLIDSSFDRAYQVGLTSLVIELMVLRALYYQASGNILSAVHQMVQALQLASPENFINSIITISPDIGRLLYKTKQHLITIEMIPSHRQILLDYIQVLLSAFNHHHNEAVNGSIQPDSDLPSVKLIENLTEKEIEILHMLTTGMSNRDITRHLVISNNTLRTHLKHIYGKLDVHDQTQAILKAREHRLI
jgi:LuxR family maltose regulon positive regulatory protein